MTTNLPAHAAERLKGLRSSAHSSGVFTSDFSVNEFLLVRKAGFAPIGLCVGSCVYHVGIQYGSWGQNQELEVLSKAMYHARELAMSRMRAEATAMGADGIVGVKLTIKRLEWDEHLLEFIAIGTGVVFTAATIGILVSSLAAERLAKKFSQKALILAGFVVTLVGIGLLVGFVHASSKVVAFVPGLLLVGLGLGVMLTPSVNVVQSSFPERLQG